MSSDPESPHSQAVDYIANPCFHQRLTLPATTDHEELTFSYAVIGRDARPTDGQPHPPTILLMPGMFASRYLGLPMHAVAKKLGVCVLVVDRPGMGSSTDVPLEQRVPVWVELVPQLLAHLGIEHVALVSHSAGAIYLLNTLYHCRGLLDPERPFVAFMATAPWVDPIHSHMTSIRFLQYIPVPAFSFWNQIPRFFHTKAGPAFASSGAVVKKLSNAVTFSNPSGDGGSPPGDDSQQQRNRQRMETEYGLPRAVQTELDVLVFRSMFEENTLGANSEALQCLRKGPGVTWGKCDDYGVFVADLVVRERERAASGDRRAKLKIRAYFAQDDDMIGKKGQQYMEECWRGKEDGDLRDVIDFESTVVEGVDHDTLVYSLETLERIFIEAGGVRGL
ncbi:Uu.00g032770.m01.CDS01 [Anthostomella pinea]|uniref:Uu.00g032770.m01.CDS01 n=1 Tax=Anthostomella pinea TaxID=933095 RepID=A0AAI8V8L2_9PEZI|nr:Uu.00g032770.m01.CDS01 [Anthostomella pinea]